MFIYSQYPWRAEFTINLRTREGDEKIDFRTVLTPDMTGRLQEGTKAIVFQGNSKRFVVHLESARIFWQNTQVQPPNWNETGKELVKHIRKNMKYLDLLATTLNPKGYEEYETIKEIMIKENFSKLPHRLLGYGTGFTPAGDDTLQGIIMALNTVHASICMEGHSRSLCSTINAFRNEVDKALNTRGTTWASRKYIEYSLNKMYDEQALQLLKSLMSKPFDALDDIRELARRGHNSGIHIALGLIWGLYYSLKTIY